MIISDRDPRFTADFYKEFCSRLGIKQNLSSTAHPQTDGQSERVNRVIEDYLRHYVDPTQRDWDTYLPMAEFAYNNAIHESTRSTPFYLNYGLDPHVPGDLALLRKVKRGNSQYLRYDAWQRIQMSYRSPACEKFTQDLQYRLARAKLYLESARQRQKRYADANRQETAFAVGDMVLLNTQNLKLKAAGSRKLLPRFIGPFRVTAIINPVACKLDLPKHFKFHDVFHVSLLKRYTGTPRPLPDPLVIEGEDEYRVKQVLEHELRGTGKHKKLWYLVSWDGYPPEYNTWEPEGHLANAKDAIQRYRKNHP
jgi:transposase InsO family protein